MHMVGPDGRPGWRTSSTASAANTGPTDWAEQWTSQTCSASSTRSRRSDWNEIHLAVDGVEVHLSAAPGVEAWRPAAGAAALPPRPVPAVPCPAGLGACGPAAAPAPSARRQRRRPRGSRARRSPPPARAIGADAAAHGGGDPVLAPSPGIFWRSPAPGQPPFVEVGARVEPDTVVCIVELMKLMNRVSAGCAGVVTAIPVGNGAPVEKGEPIVYVQPDPAAVSLRRVLVANRGEIAVRIVRACFDEGIESVAAVSDADRDSLAARRADAVVRIGPAAASASYLDVGAIVGAAIATGCDAVHPGYGFLSERPELAAECARVGLTFVGPPAEVIRRGGSKIGARALARSIGVPVGEGPTGPPRADEAAAAAERIGYPVLLKARRAAAAGAWSGSTARPACATPSTPPPARPRPRSATAPCSSSAGSATPATSRCRSWPTRHGSVIHLGERDCSAQRRFQKIVEEAPASALPRACAPRSAPPPRGSPGRSSTSARARSSSSSTSTAATSRSSRSTRGCRSSTRSPR